MKKDIVEFVEKCLTCQQIKAEHQKPAGLLESNQVPQWKWEEITMDFVISLPRTIKMHDAIWVIVDRLTNSAHFLPIRMMCTMDQLAEIYVKEIVRLDGVPIYIIWPKRLTCYNQNCSPGHQVQTIPTCCYRNRSNHKAMGIRLKFSTSFHPQTDGQSERTI